jgi:hypothetical protein
MNKLSAAAATPEVMEMSESDFVFRTKNLAGKILTIIDGALPEGKQNAAIKSLIRKEFREALNNAWYAFHRGDNCSFAGYAYQVGREVDLLDPADHLPSS